MTTVASTSETPVRVWDLPTRIFHWALVALIISAWVSYEYAEALGDPAMKWHRYNGYLVLILVVWRLLYGFVGPAPVRFATFLRGPSAVVAYARSLLGNSDRPYLSHNPLGALGVVALLAVVAVQAVLGLMSEEHNGTTWGPLYFLTTGKTREWVTEMHEEVFYLGVLGIIAVHLAGVLFHGVLRREPIVPAMVTGSKPAHDYADDDAALRTSPLAAVAIAVGCLAAAAGLVLGTIVLLGGRLVY